METRSASLGRSDPETLSQKETLLRQKHPWEREIQGNRSWLGPVRRTGREQEKPRLKRRKNLERTKSYTDERQWGLLHQLLGPGIHGSRIFFSAEERGFVLLD